MAHMLYAYMNSPGSQRPWSNDFAYCHGDRGELCRHRKRRKGLGLKSLGFEGPGV